MITMQFAAIDHIALNVDDVDRSLAFYHEALGLDIERIDDFRAGKVGFPSVRVTSQTVIDLMPGEPPFVRAGSHSTTSR
jgi:catechol 2,3-dioxygenase-like lactoylglutathione lyase family enzyme